MGRDTTARRVHGFVFVRDPESHALHIGVLAERDGTTAVPTINWRNEADTFEGIIAQIAQALQIRVRPTVISCLSAEDIEPCPGQKHSARASEDFQALVLESTKVDCWRNERREHAKSRVQWIGPMEALERIPIKRDIMLEVVRRFYSHRPAKIYASVESISKISIAVPTFNGRRTIAKTLASVVLRLAELPSCIRKEILICDDHCTDDTPKIVISLIKFYREIDIKFELIPNNGPQGKAGALNTIFEHATGEIFCVVDDDILLREFCLYYLMEELVRRRELRCVFSAWERLPLITRNPWKKTWHLVLGVKFDIQPYDKPSELMRGACMMMRRESYVRLPNSVMNEDQYLQYIYWPATYEVARSVIYFNSVTGVLDYYRRFVRIAHGSLQMRTYFAAARVAECNDELFRKIDYQRILTLPWKLKGPFIIYRAIRLVVQFLVRIRLTCGGGYGWHRIKQN